MCYDVGMDSHKRNVAYIDGANLHKGIGSLGWKLDYKRFRVWLKEKYGVTCAYLFLGLIPKNSDMYLMLQEFGYTIVFKEVTYDGNGKAKGNCDADIVVKAMEEAYENKFEMAVIVTSDGDYASLVSFLLKKEKLEVILSPGTEERCSILLKRTDAKIVYINDKRNQFERIQNKEKAPDADGTA